MKQIDNVVFLQNPTEDEVQYYELACRLRDARVRFSQEFQAARVTKGSTDEQARQAAIERTGDEITLIEAAMTIAEMRLGR